MVKFIDSATTIEVMNVVAKRFTAKSSALTPACFTASRRPFASSGAIRSRCSSTKRVRPHPIPLNQYWALYIYADDVDAMLAELKSRGVAIDRDIEDQFYGCRDFDVRDPDGHLIGIGQNLTRSPA